MNKTVIVAGSIVLDITPSFQNPGGMTSAELFKPGTLLQVGKAAIHTGGSAANTGLALKLLGAEVKIMAKIGDDEFGRLVREILQSHNAGENLISARGERTSYSVVLAPRGIDRLFLHDPGANDSFSPDDLDWNAIRGAALFHYGYPSLMRRMYLDDGASTTSLFRRVKALGVATSLDTAAIDPASGAGKTDWRLMLRNTLPYVDFFAPSIEELTYMLDRDRFERLYARARGRDITSVVTDDDVYPLADELLSLGAKVILIKCGAKGLYLVTAGEDALKSIGGGLLGNADAWANVRYFQKSFTPYRVLSATGAGDTCIAAFLQSLMHGYDSVTCAKLAAAQGAACVTEYDALSGLKTLPQLIDAVAAAQDCR